MVYREAPGDESATGTADEYGSIEMYRVHERLQVRRKIAGLVAPGGTARVTMAPLRQGESVNGLG